MHPQRDQVLNELICRTTGRKKLPANLAAVDGLREIRQFLRNAVLEAGDVDWSPQAARMILMAALEFSDNRDIFLPRHGVTWDDLKLESPPGPAAREGAGRHSHRTCGREPAVGPEAAARGRDRSLECLGAGRHGGLAGSNRGGPGTGPGSAARAARAQKRSQEHRTGYDGSIWDLAPFS